MNESIDYVGLGAILWGRLPVQRDVLATICNPLAISLENWPDPQSDALEEVRERAGHLTRVHEDEGAWEG
jgi:hypothetical protein